MELSSSSVPIFVPNGASVLSSGLTAFVLHCARLTGQDFPDQAAFHRFSISGFRDFWRLLLDWAKLPIEGNAEPVCTDDACETASFFPNLRLNYAEALLDGDDAAPAIAAYHDGAPACRLSRAELRGQVARVAASLQGLGLATGDQVVAIARNDEATVVACLAAAAVGASFSTAPPDMGEEAILSRFSQLSPRVLFCHLEASGQSIAERVALVASRLPSLVAIVTLDDGAISCQTNLSVLALADLAASSRPALRRWPRLPFNHPLFILFSSGTTGAPKCIVHGAGGTLLEHIKEHRLHCDMGRGDCLFFHTSCAWMMWNWQLSALAGGTEIVLYDGAVGGAETLWSIAARQSVSHFGTSPAYLKLCQDRSYEPARTHNLGSLRSVMSTGSILHDQQYDCSFAPSVDCRCSLSPAARTSSGASCWEAPTFRYGVARRNASALAWTSVRCRTQARRGGVTAS